MTATETATEAAAPHRALSPVERWYWICDQFSTLNVISRTRVRGGLTETAVRGALDALAARHPLLRVAVEHDHGRNPRWRPTSRPIPLRVVRAERDDQWVREVDERELVDRVDHDHGPLARAVLVSDAAGTTHDLIIVVPHIIADGTTVLTLAAQALALAAGAPPAPPARVLPPPDELRPAGYTGEQGAAILAAQTERDAELMSRLNPGRVESTEALPLAGRRTALLHRELSGEQLDRLSRACRANGTTVHGALTVAMVLAAAREAREPSRYFTVGSPIDFRAELVPPVRADEVGTYVATVPTVVDTALAFWDAARAVTADLVERKRLGDHFALVTMVVGACPDSVAQARPFLEFMQDNGPINLCSSNIGRYDFPGRIGDWAVSDAQFLTGISVNGYFVATVNSSHGALFWNFTYIREALPGDRAERLADDCVATLLTAVAEAEGE
jgi:hypothetical protein